MKIKKINLAVVGATGMVGKAILKVLYEKKVKIENLYLYASKSSAGKVVRALGIHFTVLELNEENVLKYKVDYAMLAVSSPLAIKYAKIFAENGAVVVDNSSAFRMDESVPLVVPEINFDRIKPKNKIIANPNCSTILAALPLRVLDREYGLARVVISSYQAVSGAGHLGVVDLNKKSKYGELKKFIHPIHNNIIPHIDTFVENGYTKEEMKIINETRKILNLPKLKITATTVRIPILNCHTESLNVTFKQRPNIEDIKELFKNTGGIVLVDDVDNNKYPMPIIASGKDEIFVGRIREDVSCSNTINMLACFDNIRKGAATNAVQIVVKLIETKEK